MLAPVLTVARICLSVRTRCSIIKGDEQIDLVLGMDVSFDRPTLSFKEIRIFLKEGYFQTLELFHKLWTCKILP